MAAWLAEIRGMFGERRSTRVGRAVIALSATSFLAGVAVFVGLSQTIGQLLIASGAGLGLLFLLFRRNPEAVLAGIQRRRNVLVAAGGTVVVAGWVAYFAISEIVGLLLVVLGSLPLIVLLLRVKQDPLASPLDGPPFGETGGG
jgi:hypothetical protein